jgi:hypothetical protein
MPAHEDLKALHARIDQLGRQLDRNHLATQKEITALRTGLTAHLEDTHATPAHRSPGASVIEPVTYSPIPYAYEEAWPAPAPEEDDPVPSFRRTARRWGALGLVLLLASLAAWLLLTPLVLPDPAPPSAARPGAGLLSSAGAALTHAATYRVTRSPHAPFVLLEIAILLAGGALGAGWRTLVIALLVGVVYLALRQGQMAVAFAVSVITARVVAFCLNPRR